MRKLTLLFGAIVIAAFATSHASADIWNPFNNFSMFRQSQFFFENEKKEMDVYYQNFRSAVSNGIVRLQAGRIKDDNAYGAWTLSFDRLVRTNSAVKARCRYANNASRRYVWGGFWTLYDEAIKRDLAWHFLEHDMMETFPEGSFFNRYISKNPDTNQVAVAGGLRKINGVVWWRNNWREYNVKIYRNRAKFDSNGQRTTTVRTANRAFNSRIMITNRPWGPNIFDVPARSRIADLQVDFMFIDLP